MITIDGGAGGGQILRTALTYAALSGQSVRIIGIRGSRPHPGLRPQHLLAVNATAQLCGAQVAGADLGSSQVEFTPGPIAPPSSWRLDVGTAGSVMLLLEALLPCLVFAPGPVELTLVGGTNNPWAPPYEYFRWALLPMLARMGVTAEAELARRGFYPRGGGEVSVRVQPADEIKPLQARERGPLARLWGVSYSANLPGHIAQRMAGACAERLAAEGLPDAEFAADTATPSAGPGCGMIVIAQHERSVMAGDALGERGKPAEQVGAQAADDLIRDLRSGAAVDVHMGDQLVSWVALAAGESIYTAPRVSDHLRCAAAVARQVLGAEVRISPGEPAEVRCRGVGRRRG